MKRGFSLVSVLALVGLLGALSLAAVGVLQATRGRVDAHRYATAATLTAESGADYAEAMIRQGRWRITRRFDSPDLAPGQRFTVDAQALGGGRWRIVSTGLVGTGRHTVERRLP